MSVNAEEQLAQKEAKAMAISQQVTELRKEVGYLSRDYTLEYVVQLFLAEELYITDTYAPVPSWRRQPFNKSSFVESILLGLPIPFLVCVRDPSGNCEIIDGARRVQAAVAFMAGAFKLRDLECLTTLNGCTYDDLPEECRKQLKMHNVRVTILDEKTPVASRQEIFTRLNNLEKAESFDSPTLLGVKTFNKD